VQVQRLMCYKMLWIVRMCLWAVQVRAAVVNGKHGVRCPSSHMYVYVYMWICISVGVCVYCINCVFSICRAFMHVYVCVCIVCVRVCILYVDVYSRHSVRCPSSLTYVCITFVCVYCIRVCMYIWYIRGVWVYTCVSIFECVKVYCIGCIFCVCVRINIHTCSAKN